MRCREGSVAHFLTVAEIERSARYYEKVFGARILSSLVVKAHTGRLVNDLTIVAARVRIATDSFLAGASTTNKERR
jgi:hypothetical protein